MIEDVREAVYDIHGKFSGVIQCYSLISRILVSFIALFSRQFSLFQVFSAHPVWRMGGDLPIIFPEVDAAQSRVLLPFSTITGVFQRLTRQRIR